MKKLLTALLILKCSMTGAQSANSVDSKILADRVSALSQYVLETEEYLETLEETFQELNVYRHNLLQEKFDQKIAQVEVILSKSNQEFIQEIEKHISKASEESLDDSLLMRLAQLTYERSLFDLNQKMRDYDKAVREKRAGLRKEMPDLPAPDYKKPIKYTQKLVDRFPLSPLVDKATYLLGYLLFDQEENQKAASLYEKLVKDHPNSSVADESRWRLAEYYFDQGNYDSAIYYYKRLAEKEGPFHYKAQYKWGASLFAKRDLKNAAQTFESLYEATQGNYKSGLAERQTLEDESLDYLANIRANGLRLELSTDVDARVTVALAKAYQRAQDETNFRNTYIDFVRRNPTSAFSPKFFNEVIDNFQENDLAKSAQDTRQRLIDGLSKNSSWWNLNKKDVPATVEAEDILERQLLESARQLAGESRETRYVAIAERAIKSYQQFLTEYSYSPLCYQARFELAELEYDNARYPQASARFVEVVNDMSDASLREEAAYYYVLSEAKRVGFSLVEKTALNPSRTIEGALAPATVPTEKEKAFLQAAQVFVNNVKDGQRREKVIFKSSEILFQHNQFDKVRTILEANIDESNPNEMTLRSLKLIGHTYDLENNWDKVSEVNRRLSSLAPSMSSDEQMGEVIRPGGQALSSALALEKSKRYSDAAKQYQEFAEGFPKSNDSAYALWRCADLNNRTGRISNSNRCVDLFLSRHSDSVLSPRVEFLKVQNLESLTYFVEAAQGYEKFSKKYQNLVLSKSAVRSAARLYTLMKDYSNSSRVLTELVKRDGGVAAYLELADNLALGNKNKEAQQGFLKIVKSPGVNPDQLIHALFGLAKVDPAGTKNYCSDIRSINKKFNGHLTAQSQHRLIGCDFLEISQTFAKTLRLDQIFANPEKWAQDFDTKIKNTAVRYAQLVRSNDQEWISSALFEVAENYRKAFEAFVKADDKYDAIRKSYQSKAVDFYRKALLQLDGQVTDPKYFEIIAQIKNVGKDEKILLQKEVVWPLSKKDSRVFTFETPSRDLQSQTAEWNDLKVATDSSNWPVAYDLASQLYQKESEPIWGLIKARAAFELGKKTEARTILTALTATRMTPESATSYLFAFPDGEKAEVAFQFLQKNPNALAAAMVAQANYFRIRNNPKEAINYLKLAIKTDPQFAPSYLALSQMFTIKKYYDLAQAVLDSGLRNTDGDELLQTYRGYQLLMSRLPDRAILIADQIVDSNFHKEEAAELKTYALIAKKDTAGAEKLASQLTEPASLLATRIALGQYAAAKDQVDGIEKQNPDDDRANYLLGIFYSAVQNDPVKAKKYLNLARAKGYTSSWTDYALIEDRVPSNWEGIHE